MKYTKRILLSVVAFVPFLGFADAGHVYEDAKHVYKTKVSEYQEAPAGRFFIGPDLYYQEHSVGHYGLDFGYEYRKSNSVYGRLDLDTTWGNFHSDRYNFGAEAKLGYNFSHEPRLDVIPYMGFGYYQVNDIGKVNGIHAQARVSWQYPLLGMWINYAVTDQVEFGINLKGMYTLNAKTHFDEFDIGSIAVKNRFQYQIELPTTFYLDPQKKWDLRLVPYYAKKNLGSGEKSNSYNTSYGVVNTLVTTTDMHLYQVGGRVELGFHF